MTITSLTIKNFRSIQSLNHKTTNLNIFVGQNDEGKSNVLRALDLFFNEGSQDGYAFNWSRDYCSFATSRKGKADEIAIELEITPPSSFSTQTAVVWRKIWRKEGLHKEEVHLVGGAELPQRSKIPAFLKAIRFDYVPAIKSKDYFQLLMSKVYDMLQATVEADIRSASGKFTDTLNQNTGVILTEIQRRLGLETTIELPGNLRQLFAQLEFTSISGSKPFALDQRGDGIKVRHIPIILKWLAEQANHLSAAGRPKTVTIWGYEEPENNLELKRCFELAREFVDYSQEIQTFVTTHSPAFYSVFRECAREQVGLFLVEKPQENSTSEVSVLGGNDLLALDGSMGLMSLLEPHFKEAEKEIRKLRAAAADITDTSKATIFCEGPSDKDLLNECIRLFFPDRTQDTAVRCSTHHGGGANWVTDMLVAWSFSRPTAKAVGLFDGDSAGKTAMAEANTMCKVPGSGKKAFCISLKKNNSIISCHKLGIHVPFALEELLPEDIWDIASTNGWLEPRTGLIQTYNFTATDISFDNFIASKLTDKNLLRMSLFKVKNDNKEDLTNYICQLTDDDEKKRILKDFEVTLAECLAKLHS